MGWSVLKRLSVVLRFVVVVVFLNRKALTTFRGTTHELRQKGKTFTHSLSHVSILRETWKTKPIVLLLLTLSLHSPTSFLFFSSSFRGRIKTFASASPTNHLPAWIFVSLFESWGCLICDRICWYCLVMANEWTSVPRAPRCDVLSI